MVESIKPVTQDERFTSSDESPAEVLLDSNAFEVIGIGVNPFLCFYEISRTSISSTLSSSALSFSKSIYGAIKSLAGYIYFKHVMISWGWGQAEKETATPIPSKKKVYYSQAMNDHSRDCYSVWTEGKYGVVADNLSRVILFDIEEGIVLKIWKGLELYSFLIE